MRTFIILFASILFLFDSKIVFCQTQYTVEIPSIKTSILKVDNNSYSSKTGQLQVGRITGGNYRSYIHWINILSYVPFGSEVINVEFDITWSQPDSKQIEFRDFQFYTGDIIATYASIGEGTLWKTFPATTTTYSIPELTQRVKNIVASGGELPRLGIKNQNESSSDYFLLEQSNVILRVTFLANEIIVDQKLSDNTTSIDSIGLWNSSQSRFDKFSVPQKFDWIISSTKTLQGSQKIISNQKYNNWNELPDVINHHSFIIDNQTDNLTSNFHPSYSNIKLKNNFLEGTNLNPSNDSIEFKDPWLIDYPDPQYGNQRRNRGMDAPFKQRPSPFIPDYTTSYNGDVYKGVFLNQEIAPNKPYYSVRAPETQDIPLPNIGTRTFYFLNWGGSNVAYQNANALETGVVFKDANAVAEANYKGHLFTNSPTATSSNSQRKIVQSSTGKWAMSYESMEGIWVSRSLDGINWERELIVDLDYCKYPSIAISGDIAFIVWQQVYNFLGSPIAYIKMRSYDLNNNSLGEITNITTFTPNSIDFISTPVIDGEWQLNVNYDVKMIAWREPDGIKVKYYNYSEGWSPVGTVPGTNGNCYNSSIVNYNGGSYCLTWEDRNNYSYSIKYIVASYSPGLGWNFNATAQISPTYWYDNLRPQISMVSGHKPTIVWTSYNNIVEGVSVHVRQKSGMGINDTWGNITSFSHTSSEPIEPAIGDYLGLNKYDIAWNYGGKIYKASYNGSYWNGPNIISWAGGNGVSINKNTSYQLKALWKQPGGPIALANVGGTPPPLSKSTDRNDSTNSEVVYKINRHGLIELNNVLSNENNNGTIAFEMAGLNLIKTNGEEEDIEYSSINDINPLSSTSFSLHPSDNKLKFRGAIYGMGINCNNEDLKKLNEPLFKVTINEKNSKKELKQIWSSQPIFISTVVNGTFGEFKEIEIPVNELLGKEIYINIEMIGKKKNITPLIVEDYLILSDSALQKDDIKNKMEDLQITEYKLMQNYPNPFNPSTIINYQIPKAGFVSLKVYDILGREVKTLVNEQQEKGIYNIELNMSDFSSGIYIYTIKTENFVGSKKLLLLK